MSEIKVNKKAQSSLVVRNKIKFYYEQKFFNKWMNKFEFTGLNYQQINYIMKKLWCDGTIACSKPVGIPNNLGIDMKEDTVLFTPYSPMDVWNIYDYPTKALPINTRGVAFISSKPLEIDKEIVIGFAQRNHKSVFSSIEAKLNQIVDLEMVMRTNAKGQKMPWLFVTSPENTSAVKELVQGLDNDEPILFTSLEDVDKSNTLMNGSPYILDKIQQLIQVLVNDILTFLGVNNVGVLEKKEHLVVDEVNANNQDINENSDDFLTMMNEFFERVGKVFSHTITCKNAHQVEYDEEITKEDKEEVQDETIN